MYAIRSYYAINLWEQNNLIPEAALLLRIISPTNQLNHKKLGSIMSLNFSNTISNKVRINYNIGTVTDIDKNTTGFYILNFGYEPNSKIHFFIENSGGFTFKESESNCLGTGLGMNFVITSYSIHYTKLYDKKYTQNAFNILETLNISEDKKLILKQFGEQLMNRTI